MQHCTRHHMESYLFEGKNRKQPYFVFKRRDKNMGNYLRRGGFRGMSGRRGLGRSRLNARDSTGVQSATLHPNNFEIVQDSLIQTDPEEEFVKLKTQAEDLKKQLQAINARIRELEGGSKKIARAACVNPAKCIACGICEKVCPTGAISIAAGNACIDLTKCTGCGRCVSQCPQAALWMKKV